MTSCWHCVLSISLPSPDPPPWETTPFSSCATASSALALLFPSQPFPLLSFTAVGLPSWLPAVNSETSFFLFVLFPLIVSLLSLSVPSYRFHYCFLVFVVVVVWFFSVCIQGRVGLDFDFVFMLGCKFISGFQMYLCSSGSALCQGYPVNPLRTRTTGSSSMNTPQDPAECLVQAEWMTEAF